MASEVDICNLALAHLGDDATVASLDPPEGSAQADHCARFYPMARDTMLDAHKWNFSTRRASLALLTEAAPSAWQYAYALPADALDLIAVQAPGASDDVGLAGSPTPQNFISELGPSGALVIYTNQVNAVLRYTARVTDTSRFPPLCTQALTMLLASMLAGPVLKGETGMKAAAYWEGRYDKKLLEAKAADANQRRQEATNTPTWLANR